LNQIEIRPDFGSNTPSSGIRTGDPKHLKTGGTRVVQSYGQCLRRVSVMAGPFPFIAFSPIIVVPM
jgi:hypothetical protein